MNNAIKYMPPMFTGEELRQALTVLPSYDATIRNAPTAERLIELNSLYEVYYPSAMSEEIYCKLYLALLRSLQQKESKTAITQGNLNRQGVTNGIIGGSDSFTILGKSGIGKSATINRVISLIAPKTVITTDEPYRRIAPIITVQTPFDCSVKGLLLEILRETDKALGTDYHAYAIRARATTDTAFSVTKPTYINIITLKTAAPATSMQDCASLQSLSLRARLTRVSLIQGSPPS